MDDTPALALKSFDGCEHDAVNASEYFNLPFCLFGQNQGHVHYLYESKFCLNY